MLTALGALSFFTCLREPPSFAPLEPRFPLFLRERKQGSALAVTRKNSPLLCSAGLRERQSPLSRIRLPKVRFWRALFTLLYHSARALIVNEQFDFLAILWGSKNTLAIRPSKCKSACGAATFARRCLQLYAQKYHAPSRRLRFEGHLFVLALLFRYR